MKRGAGNTGGGPVHSSFTHPPPPPPPPPPFPVFPMPPNAYANLITAMPDPSPRDPSFRSNHWDARPSGFVSQQHPGNDHRNSSRRHFGPHPHGDGTYRNNYGGRRDHDRGNYPNARDVHMQSQRAPPRGFLRPAPPNNPTFISPPPVRPFGNPMGVPGESIFYKKYLFLVCGCEANSVIMFQSLFIPCLWTLLELCSSLLMLRLLQCLFLLQTLLCLVC